MMTKKKMISTKLYKFLLLNLFITTAYSMNLTKIYLLLLVQDSFHFD